MVTLTTDELKEAYSAARKDANALFTKFNEFERLASNDLRSDLPKNLPKVNDGSLSGLLEEIPMRVLAQMVEGKVKVKDRDEPWLSELASIVWSTKIIPNAKSQGSFFQKLKVSLEDALTYGGQPAFDFFKADRDEKCSDFVLPYVRDVYLEPGKVSDLDSDYVFLITWYTKLQVKNIIKSAQDEEKAAKAEERESLNGWNIAALKKVLDTTEQAKSGESQNEEERKKQIESKGYKFVTCFQRGVGSDFYTFLDDDPDTILRTTKNENPTGDIPIHFLYRHQNFKNPYGKGIVEKWGGTQNVLDYFTQLDVLATQIGLQPPIKIAGPRANLNLNSLVYAPRQFWFTGDAQVDTVQTATQVYNQFPTRYGLYKTQLLNGLGANDASVSAESGAPGYSKTDAGVKKLEARVSAHDNDLRQQVADFVSRLGASMLNTYFNSMEGSDVLELIDEHAERLMRTGLIERGEDGKPVTTQIEITWENVRGQFEFEVDPDSSIVKDDTDQVTKILEALKLAQVDPNFDASLGQDGYRFNRGEAYNQLFMKFGLQNVEKIIVPIGAGEAAPQPAAPEGSTPAPPPPKPLVDYKSAPDSVKAQIEQAEGYQPAGQTERLMAPALAAMASSAGKPAPQPPLPPEVGPDA